MSKANFYTLLICFAVWLFWLIGITTTEQWNLFEEHWFMSVTMFFGSFIAGATSEGGGAVAFPVMTLVFDISPSIARDFSLIIQSVGMSAASISIILSGTSLEYRTLLLASLGGAVGMIVGLEVLAPIVSGPVAKVFFTSLWLSFALALFWVNRDRDRQVFDQVKSYSPLTCCLFVCVGFIGGTITSVLGSGLDIIVFALLVLRFRITEKVATPTSVILMANNAVVGTMWKTFYGSGIAPEAINFWWVCVPIVVVGAPLGAWYIRRMSRTSIAKILIFSIIIQYLAALFIIPQTPTLVAVNFIVFALGASFFFLMNYFGVESYKSKDTVEKRPTNAE